MNKKIEFGLSMARELLNNPNKDVHKYLNEECNEHILQKAEWHGIDIDDYDDIIELEKEIDLIEEEARIEKKNLLSDYYSGRGVI